MGIQINGRKVKSFLSGTFKGAVCLAIVAAIGSGLKGCIQEENRNSEVNAAMAGANSKDEALLAVTVSEKNIVTIEQGPLNHIYNFSTQMMVVQHSSGISAFRFADIDPKLVSDALDKGCRKAGTLRAELKNVSAKGAENDVVVELGSLKGRNEDFFKAHCMRGGAQPVAARG